MPAARRLIAISILISLAAAAAVAGAPPMITRQQIIIDADRTADAQLKALPDKISARWIWGVMEAGYADYSHVSPKGASYIKTLTQWAEQMNWTPPLKDEEGLYLADDFCIGQTYLDLYVASPSSSRIDPLRNRLDSFVQHIKAEPASVPKLTWYWCDALFMAPPTLARLSVVTHDQKYIDAMDTEYWRTVSLLYDRDEHLFYRDNRFIGKKDSSGKKIFWSRGNGWVLAGLARILQYMPAGYPSRPKYIALFKEMSARLGTLQSADGTWRASLVDPQLFDTPETSGTSLFTYGLAWGINNKLLDRKTYLPIVTRAWLALLADRRPDGLPGFVQNVGAEPKAAVRDGTQLYTSGSMLLDAVELLKLAPLDVSPTMPGYGKHTP
jgi:rhamnogalacturonyl hydrolase YesR